MGHTWFYRGCRECFGCGKVHAPPPGISEDEVERYRYASGEMPWGWDTADGSTSVVYDYGAGMDLHDRVRLNGGHVGINV